jgi:hypothetical protein
MEELRKSSVEFDIKSPPKETTLTKSGVMYGQRKVTEGTIPSEKNSSPPLPKTPTYGDKSDEETSHLEENNSGNTIHATLSPPGKTHLLPAELNPLFKHDAEAPSRPVHKPNLPENLKQTPLKLPFVDLKKFLTISDPNQKVIYDTETKTFRKEKRSLLSLNSRVGNSDEAKKTVKTIINQLHTIAINTKNENSGEAKNLLNSLKTDDKLSPWIKQVIKNNPEIQTLLDKRIDHLDQINNRYEKLKNSYGEKLITKLMEKFVDVGKNGDLYWKDKTDKNGHPIPTGQNYEKLKSALGSAYLTARHGAVIGVKLKSGESAEATGLKHDGSTFIASINLEGEIIGMSEKVKHLGAGGFGKVEKLEDSEKETSVAAKFAYVPKEYNLQGNEKKKGLERAGRDIQNEYSKGMLLNSKGDIPGLPPPPKNLFYVIRGGDKEMKIGVNNEVHSGDASEPKTWTGKWNSKDLVKGCLNLITGISHAHTIGVFSGDVKPENIGRDDTKKELFHIDWGGSATAEELWDKNNNKFKDYPFTNEYTCRGDLPLLDDAKTLPEYSEIRNKMDVFALGKSIFKILTNKDIDENSNYKGNITSVKNQNKIEEALRGQVTNQQAEKLAALISKMVNLDATERPTSQEVVEELNKLNIL